jgi:signal transduction histidine kinase
LEVRQQRLFLALVRDVTDRKRAEAELREEQQLLREMLDLQERDRKLVAYEIHDGLAQQLAGALFKFQSIDHLREHEPDVARKMFGEAVELLRESMAETRRLIDGLRPPILDKSGVIAAIASLISEQQPQGAPAIEFVHPADFGRLAVPLEGAIFRIVQESLTNACRYSQSEKVRVELRRANDRVHAEVQDWGVGFDPTRVERGHIGLQGIRERAELLGGTAVIESAPGKGTRLRIELPFLPPVENGNAG